MNRVKVSIWAAFAFLALSSSLFAHHGTAPNYDQKKVVKVTGVVREFWWRNPHSSLFIEGEGDDGTKGTFVMEMGAPAALAGMGYNRKIFKPGDHVVVTMWPSYTTPTNGQFMHSHFVNEGKEFHSTTGKD